MSREEKLREIAEQEQALMREVYGFDAGVAWAEARIIKLLEEHHGQGYSLDGTPHKHSADWDYCICMLEIRWPDLIALIKGKAE